MLEKLELFREQKPMHSYPPPPMLGFFNGFQENPVHPEDLRTDRTFPLGLRPSPGEEEPARAWVCLLNPTPELLNRGSAALRFCRPPVLPELPEQIHTTEGLPESPRRFVQGKSNTKKPQTFYLTALRPASHLRPEPTFVCSGPQSSWWPSTGPEQRPDQEQQTDLRRREGGRISVTVAALQGLMGNPPPPLKTPRTG